jgi:hypothetical protein
VIRSVCWSRICTYHEQQLISIVDRASHLIERGSDVPELAHKESAKQLYFIVVSVYLLTTYLPVHIFSRAPPHRLQAISAASCADQLQTDALSR